MLLALGGATVIAHPPAIRAAGECPGTATLVFGDDAAYSGPGPFNAFLLVKNEGVADARDVVQSLDSFILESSADGDVTTLTGVLRLND